MHSWLDLAFSPPSSAVSRILVALLCAGGVQLRADLLYQFPFENATGAGTLENFGTAESGDGVLDTKAGAYATPTLIAAGRTGGGQALSIPYSPSAITAPNMIVTGSTNQLLLTSFGESITLAAWINWHGPYSNYRGAVASKYFNASPRNGWEFGVTVDGVLYFQMVQHNYDAAVSLLSTSAVPQNVWTHVAMITQTENATSGILNNTAFYINGEPAGIASSKYQSPAFQQRLTTSGTNTLYAIRLGSQYGLSAYNYGFRGWLDDVRLYDECLDSAQIAKLAMPFGSTMIIIQ